MTAYCIVVVKCGFGHLIAGFFFFFNDTATTEIYTLSLHDALPISGLPETSARRGQLRHSARRSSGREHMRSEEHTSELQSRLHLVCRLLLEKKKRDLEYTGSDDDSKCTP